MTETALEKRPPKQLAATLSTEKRTLVRDQWFKGATELEFEMGIAICEALRLDPMRKQIHFIKIWDSDLRRNVMQPVVAIQGMRALAEETGEYCGQTEAEWCGPDGEWTTKWLTSDPPVAARCGIKRKGFPDPVYAMARFEAYCRRNKDGGLNSTWRKMPDVMISKCAESLALRKAFPGRLAGAYSDEEMDHMKVVDGGELSETKQLSEGTSSFGFKRRKQEDSKGSLMQLKGMIDKAETEDDLAQCTVNGSLEPADRTEAKEYWKARRNFIRQKQYQQSQNSPDQKQETPREPGSDDDLDESVKTHAEPEVDPWIKHMDETREQTPKNAQQEIEQAKQDKGKKSQNDKR